jgi:lipoprotein-anchoring transpeptidase ErfK/SrfK
MFHRLAIVVIAFAVCGAAVPAAGHHLPVIPEGVTVGDVAVGGYLTIQAKEMLHATYDRPVQLVSGKSTWTMAPSRFGATAAIDNAVDQAVKAKPGTHIKLAATFKRAKVRAYVNDLSRRFYEPAQDARLVGVTAGLRPAIRPGHTGVQVNKNAMVGRLLAALRSANRNFRVQLATIKTPPHVTVASFGPVVIVRRGSNQLTLFDGRKVVRRFTVATGQAQYPTPTGAFHIIVKERDPTWNPPDSEWAKDAEPIPPGPGNPLGTRWMGISSPAVGIHGTPDAASLGYSASHGCIRMAIPEAEWLFDHVDVGTPVLIVAA